jgi:hypothetical protein
MELNIALIYNKIFSITILYIRNYTYIDCDIILIYNVNRDNILIYIVTYVIDLGNVLDSNVNIYMSIY